MWNELNIVLRTLKCPKCGVKGSLFIQQNAAVIQCNRCHDTFIDPWEKGPWEEGVIDTVGEDMVASYVVPVEDAPAAEIDSARLEFMKYYYNDYLKEDAFRVVETSGEAQKKNV